MDTFLHEAAFQWGGAEQVWFSLWSANQSGQPIVIAGDRNVLDQHFPNADPQVLSSAIRTNALFRSAVPILARRLPTGKPMPGRVTLSSYAVARWLRTENPRLIYMHSPMRQIWHGAGMYSRGLAPEAIGLRALGPWLRRVDEAASQPADVIVVPSTRIADVVAHTFGVKAHGVVPPPVHRQYFEAPLRDAEDYFVWVGRIVEPVKRLRMLTGVMRQLPNERLMVIGSGRSEARVRAGSPPNVEFPGWMPRSELVRTIAGAKALVLPSMEDFGISAAEAMALGVPVVVTPEAGVSEWVLNGENGWIADGSAHSILRALQRVPHLGRGGEVRVLARRFDEDAFTTDVMDGWRELGWLT